MMSDNNIRCLLWRISSNCRIRHWHGHGIHSPTAYKFTREVFVRRRRLPQQGAIYSQLIENGFDRSVSRMLQAIYDHFGCGCCLVAGTAIAIDRQSGSETPTMYAIPASTDLNTLSEIVGQAQKKQSVICLLTPRSTIKWYNTCLTITKRHKGMSIDCRNMTVLLNFRRINREHIKL